MAYFLYFFVCEIFIGRSMDKVDTLCMEDGALDTVTIRLPKMDLKLLKALAKKMGWSIVVPSHKSGYDNAMDDIREGRVTEHANVEEYFREILK